MIVDVFTKSPLAGNPLAVFADAAGLDGGAMQAIAREFGHSETTFVVPPRDPRATCRLRCFSPTAEVFGAGHNALGAWWVLASTGRLAFAETEPVSIFHQELGTNVLPVEIAHRARLIESVSMTQRAPVFGASVEDSTELARALGLPKHDLGVAGLRPQAVSTGATHLLVPLANRRALEAVTIDTERLLRVARPLGCQGAYVFTLDVLETGSCAQARAFFPGIGIAEDPATGSAAGPLAAFLAAHGRLASGVAAVVEQGDAMGRPSRIEVLVAGDRVNVGGPCVIVAEGAMLL